MSNTNPLFSSLGFVYVELFSTKIIALSMSNPKGLLTSVQVVKQLVELGAFEALNLMYILSFFSQHIPVEMIHLGLPILDGQHIPCQTSGTLNDTFRILNMFALIDRNAQDEMASSQSSRSTQSRDMLADNIDVIRLHSVVQDFFVYELHSDKDRSKYPTWLHRAVQVFCCSYDFAHERITKKTNTGLVEDYRLYEIHGIRLREHVTRHKNSTAPVSTSSQSYHRNSILFLNVSYC